METSESQATVRELCDAVRMGCEVVGSSDCVVTHPAPLDSAGPGAVTFYSKGVAGARERIGATNAAVVLCTREVAATLGEPGDRTLLLVGNPRLAFIRIMNRFFAPPRPVGIHPTAVIHPEAKLGEDVCIGPFTYVGKAVIGDGTTVDGNAYVYDNVRIGRNCIIQAGAIIGGRSMGLERNEDGAFEQFPDLGGVAIGDDVLISAGVSIDRGTMVDTVVESGVKLDASVHVSHNCVVGGNTAICSYTELCGSVRIGRSCWIAPCACIREGLRIGDGVTVGMGAVVTSVVRDGATVYGVPAREAGQQP